MRPDNREDSSNYKSLSQQQAEVQPQPIEVLNPPAAPKQKKSRTVLVLVLLLLLLLALGAVASFGWLWYQQNGRVDNLEADLSSARNNVARLESSAKAEAKVDESSANITETKPLSDQEEVVAALSAYAHAKPGSATANVSVSVRKLQAPFASATYGDGSSFVGNGICLLKKADDIWIVLYCSQGDSEYTLKLDEMFGVPASIKS